MRTFLEESDASSLRTRHRRCALEIAARMSRTTLQDTGGRALDVSSRPSTSCRSGSRVQKFTPPAAVAFSSVAMGTVCPNRSDRSTVQALMDLDLPRFADSGDRSRPNRPWIVMTDSPASPAPVRLMGHVRSLSPCLNLDALSSDESAGPGDISAVPIYISDDCNTPVNQDQVLSDEDLPTAPCAGDRRQAIRIRDVLPEVLVVGLAQNDHICDTRRAMWGAKHPTDIPGGGSQQSCSCCGLWDF